MNEKNVQEIKNAILNNDLTFFDQKIKNYKKIKINHLSILGYAIYNGSYDLCVKILEKNYLYINTNDLEEDGFKTVLYVIESKMTFNEKVNLLNIFYHKLKENFDFSGFHTSFIGYCIAINQLSILFYIYKNFLKEEKEDLRDFMSSIEDKLLSNGDLELLHQYKKLLNIPISN